MPISDVPIVLRTWLLAEVTVQTQVATRIFAGELPAGEAISMPRKAVVITPSGGSGLGARDYGPLGENRVDVKSYGANYVESATLHWAIYELFKSMNNVRVGGVLLHRATIESRGLYIPDNPPSLNWPMYLGIYSVVMNEG